MHACIHTYIDLYMFIGLHIYRVLWLIFIFSAQNFPHFTRWLFHAFRIPHFTLTQQISIYRAKFPDDFLSLHKQPFITEHFDS